MPPRHRRFVPHPRRYEGRVGNCHVTVLGTIQGLAGESRHVESAWESAAGPIPHPDAVALGVPPEDVENLRRIGAEGLEKFMTADLDTGSYEEWILPQLSAFGDIAMPPDDLLLAERLAEGAGAPLVPLDLDDEAHADLFVEHVSGFQMIRGQMRQKRLVANAADMAESAEELMLVWDAGFTAMRAYRRFEESREEHMAAGIRRLATRHRWVLAVVPYARARGIAARIGATAADTVSEVH
jgi:hypothetical protein